MKKRLQNKAFWVSAIAFIVLIVKTFTKYELPANFDVIVNMGLSLLVGMGILIDPSSPGLYDQPKTDK